MAEQPLVGRFGHSPMLEHMARHWLEDVKLLAGIWPPDQDPEDHSEPLTGEERELLRAVINTIARSAVSMLDDQEE